MKCIDLVIHDHSVLRRSLDILDGMVNKLEDGERIEIRDVASILGFLRVFGDEYHVATEERVLVPALVRAAPQESRLAQMLLEHTEERTLIAAIQAALRRRSGRDFAVPSRRLSVLLRSHFDKEEDVLDQIAEGSLSKEEDDAAVSEFTKSYKPPETFLNFAQLERKYGARPRVARADAVRGQGAAAYK